MSLTHIDTHGNARMVDVTEKDISLREAIAIGKIHMNSETLKLIADGNMPKGDVISTARIAGILAAKKTWELIPMCHQIPLDSIKLEFNNNIMESCIEITATAKCTWKTGVEMEALTAVSVACLTVYDMCKAVDKRMEIGSIMLIKKIGGKSGLYERKDIFEV